MPQTNGLPDPDTDRSVTMPEQTIAVDEASLGSTEAVREFRRWLRGELVKLEHRQGVRDRNPPPAWWRPRPYRGVGRRRG